MPAVSRISDAKLCVGLGADTVPPTMHSKRSLTLNQVFAGVIPQARCKEANEVPWGDWAMNSLFFCAQLDEGEKGAEPGTRGVFFRG